MAEYGWATWVWPGVGEEQVETVWVGVLVSGGVAAHHRQGSWGIPECCIEGDLRPIATGHPLLDPGVGNLQHEVLRRSGGRICRVTYREVGHLRRRIDAALVEMFDHSLWEYAPRTQETGEYCRCNLLQIR